MGLFWPVQNQTTMKPLMKENEDYCFTEIPLGDDLVSAIKLLRGPFEHVVYYYGHVKIVPEGDVHKLAYQFTIWDSASFTRDQLTKSQEFMTHIGDVLVAIIADENKSGEYDGPTRIDDTQEPDLQ